MKKRVFLVLIIAALMAMSCAIPGSEEDEGGGGSTLSEGVWKNGNITDSDKTNEYSIKVTSGTYYFIWWNDSSSGDGTKTGNVRVDAKYSDGTTLFTNVDGAWNTPRLIISDRTGTIILNVEGFYSSSVGTYAIRYTTRDGDAVGLSDDAWCSDNIITGGQTNQYSIDVTSGAYYFIWLNDRDSGDGTKTCDIRVDAKYSDGTTLFTNLDSAWNTPRLIMSDRYGTIILNVKGFYSSSVGTYAIKYTTRPGGNVDLPENMWIDDRITASGQINNYSLYVTSGTTYYIWLNDSDSGIGTKTGDVRVDAKYSGGVTLFTGVDSAWSTPRSFTASSTGTVILGVSGRLSSSTGTYAVAYSTTNIRP